MDVLPEDRCRALLERAMVGHLGVIVEDRPYVTPVSFVLTSTTVAFRSGRGRRLGALRDRPVVSFEVSEYSANGDWESVIVTGRAVEVGDPHRAGTIMAALLRKYRDAVDPISMPLGGIGEDPVVIEVTLDEVSGRQAGSFFSVRTRPGRL